jgi:quercetin dioxygenase-like cupin family protein
MSGTRIDFEGEAWQTTAPGARHKMTERAGKRLRLVEFATEFVEPDWCLKGHVGYVLGGKLELEFEDRVERYGPGDGFVVRPGGVDKHKARAVGSTARLFLVEDV